MCCSLNKISSPQDAKKVTNPGHHSHQDFFIKFHGRRVNLLTPLSQQNPLKDLAKRIGHILAAIFVYPTWGIVKLTEKCQPQKDIVKDLEAPPKISPNKIKKTSFNDMGKDHIKKDLLKYFDEWKVWRGFKGDEVMVFAAFQIAQPPYKAKKFVKNIVLKNDRQCIKAHIKSLANSINDKFSNSLVDHKWEICVRIYIVSEIKKSSVRFQRLSFTAGLDEFNPNHYTSISFNIPYKVSPQAFMDYEFKREPKQLQMPEYPWDERGKFKPVTVEIT